ncbi:hypothetical protein [Neorhizobium galegae]|uniref:hypothetical protein n=1 Tax=Neorhizobium galegae TaxID=399 RepID=UPI00127A4083|nr:hypothetical protein [Neorhizobium galegae]KAA9383192.1 hypothetical protein F4V88_22885 [Neorhizobium galegae]KAB1113876.1 hypothetical protein F4V89_11190 [Neorhizobium galegae]MCM2497614.1 hypothetical protein [Neorhizobium galegae]
MMKKNIPTSAGHRKILEDRPSAQLGRRTLLKGIGVGLVAAAGSTLLPGESLDACPRGLSGENPHVSWRYSRCDKRSFGQPRLSAAGDRKSARLSAEVHHAGARNDLRAQPLHRREIRHRRA